MVLNKARHSVASVFPLSTEEERVAGVSKIEPCDRKTLLFDHNLLMSCYIFFLLLQHDALLLHSAAAVLTRADRWPFGHWTIVCGNQVICPAAGAPSAPASRAQAPGTTLLLAMLLLLPGLVANAGVQSGVPELS